MQHNDKKDTWTFPEVSLYAGIDPQNYPSDSIRLLYDVKIAELNKEIELKNEQIAALHQQLAERSGQNIQAEENFRKSIEAINSAIPAINKNMTDMILLLSKKFVKTILAKEIEFDDSVSIGLYACLCEEIKEEGVIQVEVSQADFDILTTCELSDLITMTVNPSLSRGDFIFNTKSGVFIHRIEDRVDKLMRSYYG